MPADLRSGSFEKAIERLGDVLSMAPDQVVRDSAIKRFELCYELAWRVIQAFLRERGLDCRSPRDCFREAFSYGLLQNEQVWVQMLQDRNLSVHTYNEELADQVFSRLPKYLPAFQELQAELRAEI